MCMSSEGGSYRGGTYTQIGEREFAQILSKADCGLLQCLQHMTQNHRNILRAYSMKSIPVQISPDKIFLCVKLDSIVVSLQLTKSSLAKHGGAYFRITNTCEQK